MWRALRILLTAYIGFALVLYFFQSHLVFYPETGREIIAAPSQVGLPHEDIRLTTDDGLSLHGWFIPAAEARGTVLFLHGNAGNISHRIDTLQMFHRLGYSTLIFDYRGYGNSGGTPSEQGTYRDAEAAWRWLVEEKRVRPEDIVVYGESLGNAIALETALRHPPRALILESAFTSVVDMGELIFPFLPVRAMTTIRYDNLAKIPRVSCPVLVMHSREDSIVPFEMGRRLFEAAPEPKRFFELKGSHDEGYIDTGEAYSGEILGFLAGLKGR